MTLRPAWTAALTMTLALAACNGEGVEGGGGGVTAEEPDLEEREIGDDVADPFDTIAPAPKEPPVPGMDEEGE